MVKSGLYRGGMRCIFCAPPISALFVLEMMESDFKLAQEVALSCIVTTERLGSATVSGPTPEESDQQGSMCLGLL